MGAAAWLADYRNEEGINGYWQAQEFTKQLAHASTDRIIKTNAFYGLAEIVGFEAARTFMLTRCWAHILPSAQAYVLSSNQPDLNRQTRGVTVADSTFKDILKLAWPSAEVPIRFERRRLDPKTIRTNLRRRLRAVVDAIPSPTVAAGVNSLVNVGVECEHEEISRGTFLGWLRRLPTDRVILCPFYQPHAVPKSLLSEFEAEGFRYVSLDRGAVAGDRNFWRPGLIRHPSVTAYKRAIQDFGDPQGLERWVARESVSLLHQVDYWRAFFSRHKIGIHVTYDGRPEYGIPKRIALKKEGGVLLLLQRSHVVADGIIPGRRPADIVLSWGDPEAVIGTGNENYNEWVVITGLSESSTFADEKDQGLEYRQQVAQRGANFIISLFDNAISPDLMYPRNTAESLYRHFLVWVLENQDHGLIIKPKHNETLQHLGDLRSLLNEAKATGRCLVLGEETSVPSASFAADLCVGLGHSSAAIISAITGCRSVLCDLGMTPNDPLASSGLGSILFYDLESLSIAIANCKEDPTCSPVGDWTPILREMDPFRDNRSGERIESYLRHLLEAFDEGCNRDTAIHHANESYSKVWGGEKVLKPDD